MFHMLTPLAQRNMAQRANLNSPWNLTVLAKMDAQIMMRARALVGSCCGEPQHKNRQNRRGKAKIRNTLPVT